MAIDSKAEIQRSFYSEWVVHRLVGHHLNGLEVNASIVRLDRRLVHCSLDRGSIVAGSDPPAVHKITRMHVASRAHSYAGYSRRVRGEREDSYDTRI